MSAYRDALADLLEWAESVSAGWVPGPAAVTRARALMVEAQPQPGQPTDEDERGTVIAWLIEQAIQAADNNSPDAAGRLTLAAQLLGESSPAPEPVSVAERLPTQELNELDDQGTCWMFHQLNFHYCLCRPDPSVHTHWLPHWALPVPQEPVSVAERLRLVAAGIRYGYMAGHDATVEGRYGDPDEVAAECATQVLQEQADHNHNG